MSLCITSGQAFALKAEELPLWKIFHSIGLCNSCSHSYEQVICKMEMVNFYKSK